MRFYKVTVSGSFLPDAPSTRSLGAVGSEFLKVHSDDFFGDLTGDIRTDDDQLVLFNGGNDPTASTFAGTAEAAKYSA
jgi:hypothetical protein